ncbi:MAG: DHA2 family efflux MFS transporter permease subunit [Thermoleophilia bacterium]|nr:DHA2 family efflux MFS transporter permease subunit [Thermoleophilia bacterium]
MTDRSTTLWTFAITSIALFMVSLDNLVVSTAIPVIRTDLNASLEDLSWTVNAYTLTFAVLLLTGAALGDRFGRRRMFAIGVGIFTAASVVAALAPNVEVLNLARAIQGLGGAIVMPLTLTILSAAVPPAKRGLALGAWGAIGGVAIALGPVVGGAVVEGFSWQYIFWLNVPIGILLVPLALLRLTETHGPAGKLDLPGVGLVSTGMLGIVWGLIRGNEQGWTSPEILAAFGLGSALVAAFIAWELRAPAPMLPMKFFRNKAFSLANLASLFMFFGMFGSIFLLTQFFQTVQGYSPLGSGLRILPWTLAPMFVAPFAGAMSDRVSPKRILGIGLTLQAIGLGWIAFITTSSAPYVSFVIPFTLAGVGMGLFFTPMANLVLSSVRREQEGQASGANNAIRELGGVFGVAALASVFARSGGYETGQTFVDGAVPALWIGAVVVGLGAVAALAIPSVRRERAVESEALTPVADAA